MPPDDIRPLLDAGRAVTYPVWRETGAS